LGASGSQPAGAGGEDPIGIGIDGGIGFEMEFEVEVEFEDEFGIDGTSVGIGYRLCFGIGGQARTSPSIEAEPPVIAESRLPSMACAPLHRPTLDQPPQPTTEPNTALKTSRATRTGPTLPRPEPSGAQEPGKVLTSI
jgi:hypothetical protein